MPKTTSIPTWELNQLDYHHLGEAQSYPPARAAFRYFHINKLEDYRSKVRLPFPPHRKEVYDFMFVTKGSTRRSKSLNTYDITENTLFFLPAYQITDDTYASLDLSGYYCHFNFDMFIKHLPQINMLQDFPFLQFMGNPLVAINPSIKPSLLYIFQRLEAEYQKNEETNFDIITAYMFTLFTEIKQFYNPSVSIKKNTALTTTQNFKDALSRYIYDKQKVSEYANMLNVSPNHLNKCVKAVTGNSAQDLLNEMILLEAKVLLKQSDMPINEIAFKLTQQDHSSFTRFFKSQTGMTPKEYIQSTQ